MTSAQAAGKMDQAAIVEELRSRIVEYSEGKLRAEEVDAGQSILDQGYVDSLSAVMLLAHIEERWGVTIEDTELLEGLNTLDAMAQRVLEGL